LFIFPQLFLCRSVSGRWRLYFLYLPTKRYRDWQGLNVFGVLRGIAQHFANPGDGIVQAVVEIDEGVSRPELTPQLLASDEAASTLQQDCKNLDGLTLRRNLMPRFRNSPAWRSRSKESKTTGCAPLRRVPTCSPKCKTKAITTLDAGQAPNVQVKFSFQLG